MRDELAARLEQAAIQLRMGDDESVLRTLAEVADTVRGMGDHSGDLHRFIVMWRTILPFHPQPQSRLAPGIKDALRTALTREEGRDWEATFKRVAASAFLSGRATGFRPSLVWVCTKSNLAKIDAGNFDDAHSGTRNRTQTLVIEADKAFNLLQGRDASGPQQLEAGSGGLLQ